MRALEFVAERLRREVEKEIFSVGVLARVFARGKSKNSLDSKLQREPGKYKRGGRLIQDGIGVRLALYFADDVEIAEELLKSRYAYLPESSSIDEIDESTFNVVRRNLIFRLPDEQAEEVRRSGLFQLPLDQTFEVQLRSMLSEGWHEVEHDLRYKCRHHWDGYSDLNRALNGVFATLETSEWSMLKIFDDLALRHYREKHWAAMAHARFRVRANPELAPEIVDYLNSNAVAAKQLFRANRRVLLLELHKSRIFLPITLNNFVFLWNKLVFGDPDLAHLAPQPVADALAELAPESAGVGTCRTA